MYRGFTLLVFLLCIISSNAQSPQTLYADLEYAAFVGYDNGYPVFYKTADEYGLYLATNSSEDSLSIKRVRESKLPVWNNEMRLLWINDDMEIYTIRQSQPNNNRDFIIATKNGIDTVFVELNSFYQHDYEPFVITDDRKTLFAVQPGAYQDELLGWYYDNIMKIDLTKKPLVAEKLPVTGIHMQRAGNYLYYKGGSGLLQNAILRVEISKWEQIDTLLFHVGYWFVNDDILYAKIGGYTNQDAWIGLRFENKFVAYSINEKKCAIISEIVSGSTEIQPVFFQGHFYNLLSRGIRKIDIPKVTEFPYRQTLPK